MGFLAIFFFSMSRGLAYCMNPQPGGPGGFWSRFSSSNPSYASIKLQGSSASFGPPRVFYFPSTRHIWWAFPYPSPGEAPDGRKGINGRRLEGQRELEEEDNIIVKWAQEDVEKFCNLLNK